MKNVLLILLFFAECVNCQAQSGFIFQPQIGFGVSKMSGVNGPNVNCDCGLGIGHQNPVFSFNVEAKIGYQFEHLRLSTGLQFIRTSALQDAALYNTSGGSSYSIAVADMYPHYDLLLVPVSLGYQIPLRNGWNLTPEIGTQLLFLKENNQEYNNSGGFFFSGKFNFEKKLRGNMSLVISPAFYNVIIPVYYNDIGTTILPTHFAYKAVNDVFILQAGLLWQFSHGAKAKVVKRKKVTHKEPF